MKRFLIVGLIQFFFSNVRAETKGELLLRAYVAPIIRTSFNQKLINSRQILLVISSQSNLEHPSETQKFEVEGIDQNGLDSHVKKIESKDHTVQYEILINRLQHTLPESRPILLKISAN
jgi:hypothetical protein